MTEMPIEIMGQRVEHFADQTTGVIDVGQQGNEYGKQQISKGAEYIDIPEAGKYASKYYSADCVVYTCHNTLLDIYLNIHNITNIRNSITCLTCLT